MISWFQTYFQKHVKLVLILLLVAVIIPFVFVIGATPGIGQAERKPLQQPFFGHNLGNETEASKLFRDAQFSAQLRGAFQATGPQLQQFALNRIAGLALADELALPPPTEAQVSAYIAQLPVFQNEQGQFDQQRYTQFGDALKNNPQFSAADAARVMRDDARLDQLSKLLGGPGYVTEADVKEQLTRSDSTWSVNVASLDYAKFNPDIPVNDAAVQKFFEENSFRYEIPARPRLSVVEFKTAEFMPANAPTEAEARAFYEANAARFPAPPEEKKDEKAPALSLDKLGAPASDNFPKVRAQVEAAMKQEAARRAASKAANDFTVALYERRVKPNSPELESFLTSHGRAATPIAPFTFDSPPSDRPWLAGYADELRRLSADRLFSDPLPTPDGFAVALWRESLAAHQPLLVEVREKVVADYRESEKRKRFIEHGRALKTKLENAVKSGTDFAKAAGAEGLEVKAYENFTLRQPPREMPYQAATAIPSLEAGQVSDMTAAADKGYLVHVAQKRLPDLAAGSARYAEVRQQLMQFTASANEGAVLNALVEAELRKNAPAGAQP
jgi:peptidyl-prolyl cis-trans isomerase D